MLYIKYFHIHNLEIGDDPTHVNLQYAEDLHMSPGPGVIYPDIICVILSGGQVTFIK
jgi:sugar phosphate isomerase/epimerase